MTRGFGRPPTWAMIVMGAGVLAVAGMMVVSMNRSTVSSAAVSTPTPTAGVAETVRVVAIGDSYTEGTALGGQGPAGWPRLIAADLSDAGRNVTVDVVASGGAGYVARGPAGKTFLELAHEAAPDHDLVILFGSRNDTAPQADVQAAASAVYAAVRAGNPEARLLVVGPPWVDADPPEEVLAARDAVAAATAAAGAEFVDPLAEGWFADHPELIGADGVHPTDAGHRYLADLIAPHVRAMIG